MKRALDALRAIAANPGGLRFNAYPSVIPRLQERGLIRVREGGKPLWLLTDASRRVIRELGRGDPWGRDDGLGWIFAVPLLSTDPKIADVRQLAENG